MDVAKLARMQAVNRVVVGAGLMLLPRRFARTWVGRWAGDERAGVLARSMGARDLALGASGLLAERRGSREWARFSYAAQAFADAVDLVAIEAAGRKVPLSSRLFGGAMAAGSAAVAAAHAAGMASQNAQP
jgi:hypothetical protein